MDGTIEVASAQSVGRSASLIARVEQALEWPMAICALAVIPGLLMDRDGATPRVHEIALAINWFVWLAFCAEFGFRTAYSPDRRAFLRRCWFDLLIILVSPPFGVPEGLQAVRVVRAARVLRLLRVARAAAFFTIGLRASRRALEHRKFHYVLLVTIGLVFLGATGLWVIEGDSNPAVKSFGDALWWAATTTTTVGYGDVYPTTGEGRIIAMGLMVTGIGMIAIFTASVASLVLSSGDDQLAALQKRLNEMDAKMDRLLAERDTPSVQDERESL